MPLCPLKGVPMEERRQCPNLRNDVRCDGSEDLAKESRCLHCLNRDDDPKGGDTPLIAGDEGKEAVHV